jgi:hypothetical protein
MSLADIIASIDSEVIGLQQVRTLLTRDGCRLTPGPKRRAARFMTAEARKRIGDAPRKRWAKQKAAKKAG